MDLDGCGRELFLSHVVATWSVPLSVTILGIDPRIAVLRTPA
jgi:hypothetical protein